MNAIANFATWVWNGIVTAAKALNRALATPPPLETDGFAHPHDDTVFQPRDF
jgi:hypothetical protein